jgi:antirestriction protein ArdC
LKNDIYQTITDRILEKMAAGVAPWRKEWKAGMAPQNAISGKAYRGVNYITLGMMGYSDPRWLTFKQALSLGGCVRKGEKSMPVVFWKWLEADDKKSGDSRRIPLLKSYCVFNVEQCDGLAKLKPLEDFIKPTHDMKPCEVAELIVANMPLLPKISHGGDRAFYSPATDAVQMPTREQFVTMESYYATLFHELTHATGAAKRLNRPGVTNFDKFGSDKYALEELVAEFGAAFLCGQAGVDSSIDQSAAYLAGWSERFKADPKLLIQAGGQAQRAADYVLGIKHGEQKEESEE